MNTLANRLTEQQTTAPYSAQKEKDNDRGVFTMDLNLENVAGLLPDTAQQIATLIGLPRTLQLVETLGGTTFPVSRNKRNAGQLRYDALAGTVGVEAANILCQAFDADVLLIPRCTLALRELRDRRMRADFDAITRDNTAIYAVSHLARKYRLTERQIWRILKHTDVYTIEESSTENDLTQILRG